MEASFKMIFLKIFSNAVVTSVSCSLGAPDFGEGSRLSNIGRRVDKLVPILRWAIDSLPVADRHDFWAVGCAATCLGILVIARMLGRGLARGRTCVRGVGMGCCHSRMNGAVA